MAIDPNNIVLPDPESLDEDIAIVELGHMFLEMWRREAAFIKKYGDMQIQQVEDRLNGISDAISIIVRQITHTSAVSFDGLFVKFLALEWQLPSSRWEAISHADTIDKQLIASMLQDVKAQSFLYRAEHNEIEMAQAA